MLLRLGAASLEHRSLVGTQKQELEFEERSLRDRLDLVSVQDVAVDRRDLRRRLFHLASEQAGYFTAAQAKTLGYSHQAQAHHVAAANWLRIDRGLFRLTEWIPGVHDELSRWTLWSRGTAVVSHESALSVHELGEFESAHVHWPLSDPQQKRLG